MSALEQSVVDLTNQARAQAGLPPLAVSGLLVTAALLFLSRTLADGAQQVGRK